MRIKEKTNSKIKVGTTILTEKPFVCIVKSKLHAEICDNCFQRTKLLKCSGCQYVHYCNRVCQKEAWADHKLECANIRRISPRIIPDAVRLMARIIMKLKKGGDQQKGYYTKTNFRKFKDLMSHYSDIKIDQYRMEHFSTVCTVLFEYIGESYLPNSAEIMGIFGRMCINGFNILDSEMMSIGTGLYLGVSILDHSCEPNAVAVFQGTTIFIRTLKTLDSLDFSKIFISYIDLLNSQKERQEELLQSYYFLCQCSRCLTEENQSITDIAACPNINCSNSVVLNVNDNSYVNSCDQCGTKISSDFINLFFDVKDFTQMHLQIMKQASMVYLDVCKICLKKQHGIFHKLNLLHVKVLDGAFESSIEMGQWDDAKNYGIKLIPGYKMYYGEKHPLLGILYLKIGKILVHQNESKEALPYLQQASSVLHVTHGVSHLLCRQELNPLIYQASLESGVILQNS